MKHLVEQYLVDQKDAWSESTWKSEASRLRRAAHLLEETPLTVYNKLKAEGQKPYTIKTTFVRIVSLETWARDKGHITEAPFKEFMKKHRNQFKHVYEKEELEITYEQAKELISKLKEPHRTQAAGMLETGVRLFEAYKISKGKVIGKGKKPRKVYGTIDMTAPRSTFSRHLKAVGLKSHMLRKLCATRLQELGATPQDLCKIFGWTSIQTAYNYLQAKEDVRLQTLIQEATEET